MKIKNQLVMECLVVVDVAREKRIILAAVFYVSILVPTPHPYVYIHPIYLS